MSHAEAGSEIAVDAGIAAALQAMAGRITPVDPSVQTPEEMRRQAVASASLWDDGKPTVAHVETLDISGPAGDMRARWFDPREQLSEPEAVTLFLHGGGWTIGNIDTHDRLMRCLATETGCPVLGIDYRLSPEHPFPAALNDSLTAFDWLVCRASRLRIDPACIAIVGDSSGANLALAAALALRDGGQRMPAALALFYPCLDPECDSPSQRAIGDGRYGLTTERLAYYWRNYLGDRTGDPPQLAVPSRAALEGLPRTYVCLAELDPLADDAQRLAVRLAEAAVPSRLDCWPRAIHGFMQMTRDVPLARAAVARAADFLSCRH